MTKTQCRGLFHLLSMYKLKRCLWNAMIFQHINVLSRVSFQRNKCIKVPTCFFFREAIMCFLISLILPKSHTENTETWNCWRKNCWNCWSFHCFIRCRLFIHWETAVWLRGHTNTSQKLHNHGRFIGLIGFTVEEKMLLTERESKRTKKRQNQIKKHLF